MHVAQNGVLELGGSAIALVEDISEDASNALVGSPAMGQAFVDHLGTQSTYTYSFTLKGVPGEASHAAILPGAVLTLAWYPDGNLSGNIRRANTIVIGSVGRSGSAGGESKMTVSASSKGVPVETTVV